MLIVSQDRKRLFNLNQTKLLEVYEADEDRIGIWGDNYIIGQYRTEIRAGEILAEIVNEYKNRIPDRNTVYYMPEE